MSSAWDYKQSPWYPNEEKSQRWLACLERTGAENVRYRLAQTDAGSAGAIAIGIETTLTIGFAQEWLAWKDRCTSEKEDAFRRRQIFWTRWAAIVATIIACGSALNLLWPYVKAAIP
jgi:hypothetical protein